MKLLILSDSHTDVQALLDAARREQPDIVLHLGDHYADAQQLKAHFPDMALYAVQGNTDFSAGAPNELSLTLLGHRLYLTHGHLYGVKAGLSRLIHKAAGVDATIALFGHTHMPLVHEQGKLLLINPGAAGRFSRGLSRRGATYAVLALEEGKAPEARIVEG